MQLRDGDVNLTTLAGRIFKNDHLIEMGKMIKPVAKKIEKKKQNLTRDNNLVTVNNNGTNQQQNSRKDLIIELEHSVQWVNMFLMNQLLQETFWGK